MELEAPDFMRWPTVQNGDLRLGVPRCISAFSTIQRRDGTGTLKSNARFRNGPSGAMGIGRAVQR